MFWKQARTALSRVARCTASAAAAACNIWLPKSKRNIFKKSNVKISSASLMRNCPKILLSIQGMPGVTETVLASCSVAVLIAAQSQKIAAQARRLLKVLLTAQSLDSAAKKAITSSRSKIAPCSRTV